jgi:hypothetical protein
MNASLLDALVIESLGFSAFGLLMVSCPTCSPARPPAASARVRGISPEAWAASCCCKVADRPGTVRSGTIPPDAMPPPNMAATLLSEGMTPPEATPNP